MTPHSARSALVGFGLLLSISCAPGRETEDTSKLALFTSGGPVVLSEIHYDNVGTDTGEAIEIQGPAGTDVTGYSIVLYNGSNGTPYDMVVLSGIIEEEQGGLGTMVVEFPPNGLQNGSPDGVAFVDGAGQLLQFLSYEGTLTALGGPADGQTSTDLGAQESSGPPVGHALQLTEGSGGVVSWQLLPETFGKLNSVSQEPPEPELGACGDPTTAVSAVQGTGLTSALVGQNVEVEGIVVASFQGGGEALGGFFLQSIEADDDPRTSEGLFVYDQGAQPFIDVSAGKRVRVLGKIGEFSGLTEIDAHGVLDCGTSPLPAPVPLPLPVATPAIWESFEGMLVQASDLTVTESYDLGRYGEVVLAHGGRLFQPTNGTDPGEAGTRTIVFDDARDAQNPDPVPYLGEGNTLRLGDELASVLAVLHEGFGSYRLQPVDREGVHFTRANARTSAPAPVGGNIRVASLNVLNYFVTLGERGADTEEELIRQRAKLVSAIRAIDADVLGLVEVENNTAEGVPAALDDLVKSINAVLGAGTYARAPDPDSTGTDEIRTALLYKPAEVRVIGPSASSHDGSFVRPPIAATFSARGDRFSVVVNHFKSKGDCPDDADDPNAEHGQGCWNALRVEQAQALLRFVDEIRESSGDPDVVVLGDLNSYFAEDPIAALAAGGLVNQVNTLPPEARYSFAFRGQAGVLDYAFTTPSVPVTGFHIWHINADEPRLLDYNMEFNPPSLYFPDPYRSSDHDPVILGIEVPTDLAALARDLVELVEHVSTQASLPARARARLVSSVRLAQWKIELASRRGENTFVGAIALWFASGTLRAFEHDVAHWEARGQLTEEQTTDLLRISTELRDLL